MSPNQESAILDTASVRAIAVHIKLVYVHGPIADAASALVNLAEERDQLRRELDGLLALSVAGRTVAGPSALPCAVS